mgnify:CR=1 FL=1
MFKVLLADDFHPEANIKKMESGEPLNDEDRAPWLANLNELAQEKTKTREYDLFQEELKIRDKLRLLDNTLIEESDFHDILSGFEEVGTRESNFLERYAIILPLLVLSLMILSFVLFNVFNFIKNYE